MTVDLSIYELEVLIELLDEKSERVPLGETELSAYATLEYALEYENDLLRLEDQHHDD